MLLCFFRDDISKRAKPVLACLVLSASVVSWVSLQCRAAEPLVPSLPQTEWISGPASVSLGDEAQLKVPQSYKFADAQGARALLTNGVPKRLAGVLAPDSGGWLAVISFADVGYLADPSAEKLDAAAILSSLSDQNGVRSREQAKQGPAASSTLDWELRPLYDAADHTLEWALREESKSGSVVTHTVRVLGRRGVLNVVVTRPYRGFSDLAPVKQLVKGLAFREGERYADYRSGDKLAASGLTALIALETPSRQTPIAVAAAAVKPTEKPRVPWVWVGASAGAVCLAGLVAVTMLRRRTRRGHPEPQRTSVEPIAPGSSPVGMARAAGQPLAPALPKSPSFAADFKTRRATAPGGVKIKTAPAGKRANGHHAPKREFDYNRYFSDLLSAVSSHSSHLEAPALNGFSHDRGNAAALAAAQEKTEPSGFNGMHGTSDLIANQRALIEEQKRLIHEQSKLIEEKTKLIAEKNQLLKMQSDMLDHKLL